MGTADIRVSIGGFWGSIIQGTQKVVDQFRRERIEIDRASKIYQFYISALYIYGYVLALYVAMDNRDTVEIEDGVEYLEEDVSDFLLSQEAATVRVQEFMQVDRGRVPLDHCSVRINSSSVLEDQIEEATIFIEIEKPSYFFVIDALQYVELRWNQSKFLILCPTLKWNPILVDDFHGDYFAASKARILPRYPRTCGPSADGESRGSSVYL